MLRNSTFLAIALGVSAIASATNPAAAFSSQFLGGASNHLVPQMQPAAASTRIQSSQDAAHVLTPVSPAPKVVTAGRTSIGNAEMPMPKPAGKTSVGRIEEPIPKGPIASGPFWPPKCEAMPYGKCDPGGGGGGGGGGTGGGGTGGGSSGGKSGSGTVVILAPPVQVPVFVPNGVSSRVTSGLSYVGAAQPRPAVAFQPVPPQCGAASSIPPLAAGIDQLLPTAQLSEADMAKVTELRQMIQLLATDGKVPAARDLEEIAMNVLGYQKVLLRCGFGTFDWERQAATTPAGFVK